MNIVTILAVEKLWKSEDFVAQAIYTRLWPPIVLIHIASLVILKVE